MPHCLVTDGAYEEQGGGALRFLAAPPPTPERLMAVLAQVHQVVRAADDDIDPALAACVQLSLTPPLTLTHRRAGPLAACWPNRIRVSPRGSSLAVVVVHESADAWSCMSYP